jgi:hypothetical protein
MLTPRPVVGLPQGDVCAQGARGFEAGLDLLRTLRFSIVGAPSAPHPGLAPHPTVHSATMPARAQGDSRPVMRCLFSYHSVRGPLALSSRLRLGRAAGATCHGPFFVFGFAWCARWGHL